MFFTGMSCILKFVWLLRNSVCLHFFKTCHIYKCGQSLGNNKNQYHKNEIIELERLMFQMSMMVCFVVIIFQRILLSKLSTVLTTNIFLYVSKRWEKMTHTHVPPRRQYINIFLCQQYKCIMLYLINQSSNGGHSDIFLFLFLSHYKSDD